jgi:hypothetical protein
MFVYQPLILMLIATGLNGPASPASLPTPGLPADGTVVLSVSVGDRVPATLVVVPGATATVTMPGGTTLGLTPSLSDTLMDLRVRELPSQPPSATEELRDFIIRLEPGGTAQFSYADAVIKIGWTGSGEPGAAAAPDQECNDCCITCEGIRYCACKVMTVCADCCCPQCCNIIVGKPGAAPTGGTCSSRSSVAAGKDKKK